jgi:hypothetical protein
MQKTSSIYTKHATLHLSVKQEELIRQPKKTKQNDMKREQWIHEKGW